MTKKLFFCLYICVTLFACKKGSDLPSVFLPTISTNAATNITSASAKAGGTITNDNGVPIISSGLCWTTTQDPTIFNDHTTDTTVAGSFTNDITGLMPLTTYYIRAYITTIADTIYGNQISITTPEMHIYIGGYELVGSKYVAKYWKDGIATVLTNGTQDARATSVYAVGNDLYVAGYESNGTKTIAKIWKNGVATNLSNGLNDAAATSVVVNNNIVYIAGYETNGTMRVAKLWTNGVATNLTDGTNDAVATSVFLANNNVYVGGFTSDASQITHATLWTNGVVTTTISDGNNSTYTSSVFVSGNDVYMAGSDASSFANVWVMLWKNGQEMTIDQNNFFFGVGTGVSVSGNDVHLAGCSNDSGASWWKNGHASALTNSYFSKAYGIQVVGATVYIVGTKHFYDVVNGNELATLWIDGVATTLPHTGIFSYANSIYVQ